MQIAVAQLDQVIGDLRGNAAAILDAVGEAKRAGARLVITPELSLPGYPPEDLLLRPAFVDACASELGALAAAVRGHDRAGRLPGTRERQVLQRARRVARRPRRANRAQAVPAELHGLRRGAVLRAGYRAVHRGHRRPALRAHHLRRRVVSRPDAPGEGGRGAPRHRGERLALSHEAAGAAARARGRALPRDRIARRLRQPRGRTGRARLRRRLVRDRCDRGRSFSSCRRGTKRSRS